MICFEKISCTFANIDLKSYRMLLGIFPPHCVCLLLLLLLISLVLFFLPHSYSDKQPPLSREQSRSLARNYSQFPGFKHFPVKVSFFSFSLSVKLSSFLCLSLSLSLSSSLAFLFFFLRSTSNSKCYLLMNSQKHSHADVGADSTKPSFSCPGTLGRSVSVVLRPILRVDEAASN